MSTRARKCDRAAAMDDHDRRLREMNDALLVSSVHQQELTDVRVEDDGKPKPLEEELVALIFDCARELLFNVIKHAEADRATVVLRRSNGEVRVTVSDAGLGFDPGKRTQAPSERRGFGLFSIGERLSLLGARMEVASALGQGAQVSLIVPLRSQCKDCAARADRRPRRSAVRAKRLETK